MQEVADKIWANEKFHEAARLVERLWVSLDLGLEIEVPELFDVLKAIRAAAVLACSADFKHRQAAFRLATCVYGLYSGSDTTFDHALRVVLARLNNFPSMSTKPDVAAAFERLPISLALEEIEAAEKLKVSIRSDNLILSPFQKKLWDELKSGSGAAISAPTSAGKSFVLRKFVAEMIGALGSVLYIVPTRALITQVANDFYSEFQSCGEGAPEVITVSLDSSEVIPENSVFVMTQERAQILLSSQPSFVPKLLIVDEAHSISDGSRGVLLQGVVDEVVKRQPGVQVLFASPMVKNLEIFSRLFGVRSIDEVVSNEPAVLQNFIKLTIDDIKDGRFLVELVDPYNERSTFVSRVDVGGKLTSRAKILSRASVAFGKGSTNILYANGADEAEKVAINLAFLLSDRRSVVEREELAQFASESVHESYELARCLRKGVAFHYGEMPSQLRREIEQAVADGIVDYLVCTSTLLQGVNLPAKNIFLLRPEKGSNKPLVSTDFWNLAGRAGRLLKEFQGNIFLIEYDSWKVKPLLQSKKGFIRSALSAVVSDNYADLLREIRNRTRRGSSGDSGVESTFMRLFVDSRKGVIDQTLLKIGENPSSGRGCYLKAAIECMHDSIELPDAVLLQSLSISPYKQQELYVAIKNRIFSGQNKIEDMLPVHPKSGGAYASFVGILSECHRIILGLDPERRLARYHAVIAIKWMRGEPLPKIIDAQLQRFKMKKSRLVIRDVLEVVEKSLRFQAVRLITCYVAILNYVLAEVGRDSDADHITPISLFLEVGASEGTTISLISLGLSRSTAKSVAAKSLHKNLSVKEVKDWLGKVDINKFGLPDGAIKELGKLSIRAVVPDRG